MWNYQSTVHQLALHQTIDVDRGGRPGNPQVLGHAGEGRPGHAAQEGEHTKLGDGQRGSPAGAHLRADKVHHEGDRLHHLLGTKLGGDYRCRWWFHQPSPPVDRTVISLVCQDCQDGRRHELFV